MAAPNPFQNLIIGVSPGERIFSEGEIGTTMFIVQSGRVRLTRQTPTGLVTIAEMEKGDFFGEMSLLEAVPRNMSAEALEASELIEINSTTFDRMIRTNIEVAVRMLRKLSGRLQKAETLLSAIRSVPTEAPPTAASRPAPVVMSGVRSASGAAPERPSEGAPVFRAEPGAARPTSTAAGSSASSPSHARTAGAASTATPTVPGAPYAGPTATTSATATATAVAPPPAPVRPAAGAPSSGSGSLSATRPPGSMTSLSIPRNAPGAAASPATKPANDQGARLVSETGETVFPLGLREALIGRYDPVTETQPEVDLTLIDIKRSVSRRHARMTLTDGSWYLTEEVGALNGTFVNGVKLVTGNPTPLKNADKVSVGTVNLVFQA